MARRRGTGGAKRRRKSGFARLWPTARTRRRLVKRFRRTPRVVQIAAAAVAVCALLVAVNFAYQVIRKPSELFFPISESFYKEPADVVRTAVTKLETLQQELTAAYLRWEELDAKTP